MPAQVTGQASAAIKPSLTIKRRLNAPAEKVYAAWTDPKQLVRWFGPDGGPVTHAETDLRVGGKYVVIFHTENGEEHYVSGTYQEVVPNERLVFSWAWRSTPDRESLVTVTIKPDGDGVILTLLHEKFFDQETRDRHEFGWTGTMNKLAALFA